MTWKAGTLSEYADLVSWTPPSWLYAAACRNPTYRKSWWFRAGRKRLDIQIRNRARNICIYECPVRWRCLAKYSEEYDGIFGGLDAEERANLLYGVLFDDRHNPDVLRAKVERRQANRPNTIVRKGVSVEIRVS